MAEARQRSALIAQALNRAPSAGMENVYGDLLRQGTGGVKRHYELTGTLAAASAAQDAAQAELQRTLQAGAAAAAGAAGAAPATGAAGAEPAAAAPPAIAAPAPAPAKT
jgi:hypothetical protein